MAETMNTSAPAEPMQEQMHPLNFEQQLQQVEAQFPDGQVPHIYDLVVAHEFVKGIEEVPQGENQPPLYRGPDGTNLNPDLVASVRGKTDLENWKLNQDDINSIGRILKAERIDELKDTDLASFADYCKLLPPNMQPGKAFQQFKNYSWGRFDLSQLIVDYQTGRMPDYKFEDGPSGGNAKFYTQSERDYFEEREGLERGTKGIGSRQQKAGRGALLAIAAGEDTTLHVTSERADQSAEGDSDTTKKDGPKTTGQNEDEKEPAGDQADEGKGAEKANAYERDDDPDEIIDAEIVEESSEVEQASEQSAETENAYHREHKLTKARDKIRHFVHDRVS